MTILEYDGMKWVTIVDDFMGQRVSDEFTRVESTVKNLESSLTTARTTAEAALSDARSALAKAEIS